MRYFIEQEVSNVCLLYEALDWLVLSSLPISSFDDDGREIRGNLSAALNEITMGRDPLTPRELAAFGHDGDYATYIARFMGEAGADLSCGVSTDEAKEMDGESLLALFERRNKLGEELCRSDMERFEAGYRHEIERAKVEVANKILSGALPLHGFWCAGEAEIFDLEAEEHEAEARLIPHVDISPSLIDWDKSTVSIHDRKGSRAKLGAFYLVTMPTAKLIEIFPRRQGEAMQLIVQNGNAFAEGDGPQPSPPPTRGRKLKADWLPDAMRSWYSAQREAGKLGGKGMIEADLSAAVKWSEQVGKPVSRSTCQNYLRDLLSGHAKKSKA